MFRSFRGGIRFDTTNNEAKKAVIRRFSESEKLRISMDQGGGVCIPAVREGEYVLRGQCVGIPKTEEGLAVYSPVSGTVEKIEDGVHPLRGECRYVVIRDDKQNAEYQPEPAEDVSALDGRQIMEIAHRASIPGPTQYSEPEYVRILKMVRNGVKTLVCGAVECEPYIGHSTRICAEYAEQVVQGLELMMRATYTKNAVIALSSGSEEAERALRGVLNARKRRDNPAKICISQVAAKYPAATRLKKIFATRDMRFGEKTIPAGVTSPFACLSLYRAVYEGKPVTEAIITVSGSGISRPNVFEVPIGTPLEDLLRRAIVSENTKSIIMGGIMSGVALDSWDYSVLRSNTAVLAMTEVAEYSRSNECIHCNQCGKVCPEGLSPSQICEYLMQNDIAEAEKLGLADCRLCGCCTYICPGRMELTEMLKEGKKAVCK